MSYNYRETHALVLMEMLEQRRKAEEKGDDEVLNIPIILGPVGTGKTSIARSVAAEVGLDILGVNCGENGDPTDISGMAVPWSMQKDKGQGYMQWVLNKTLHEACSRGVMLFFDDIDKMPALVEGALIGIFGKREVRDRKLHPDTLILAAGNRVSDDVLAHTLSESLRTRGTVIELEATLADFNAYAEKNPSKVHPAILGYLQYRPQHLHQQREDVIRFPTQRGWVEASPLLFKYAPRAPLPSARHPAWKTILDMKCGDHIGSDFWAWYTIVSAVNLEKILLTGDLETKGPVPDATERIMLEYAAVFAVAQELNQKKVSSKYVGLEIFCEHLTPEMRVALLTQLSAAAREGLKQHLPRVGSLLLKDLITT